MQRTRKPLNATIHPSTRRTCPTRVPATRALCALCLLTAPSTRAELIINEIMYHPAPQAANSEFVELLNPDPTPVNCAGYAFTEGIQFAFPPNLTLQPGQYVILCRNKAGFSAAYPTVKSIIGAYTGNLKNGGDTLVLARLRQGRQIVVDTVEYNDKGEWPRQPDGKGPSLELIHPRFDNQFPEVWAASVGRGSPGARNSTAQMRPTPIITDVLHKPAVPPPFSPIVVIARILPHNARPVQATLLYRADGSRPLKHTSVPMADDGRHGDGRARDNIYGARISGLGEDKILDFYVSAQAFAGAPTVKKPADAPTKKLLCAFLKPADAQAEYPAYRILLTHRDKRELETRSVKSNVMLDGALVTPEHTVLYSCGVRYRGSSARLLYGGPHSYRVNLAKGITYHDTDRLNFNAVNPLLQHLGMTILRESGVPAPRTELCRLWLNNRLLTQSGESWLNAAKGGIYVRVQRLDDDFLADHYPNADNGNLYEGTHGPDKTTGELDWRGYSSHRYKDRGYTKETNVKEDNWRDLAELCNLLNNTETDNYAEKLRKRINLKEWISYFAVQIILNNDETCIATTNGDDYFLYCNPTNGQFDLLPWDMDSILDLSGKGATQQTQNKPFALKKNKSIWMTSVPSIRAFLRHGEIAPRFVARIVEILDTTMATAALDKTFATMGSALTPQYRRALTRSIKDRKQYIQTEINTEFTAVINGRTMRNGHIANVNKTTVSLSGKAPQAGIFHIRVNGQDTQWNPVRATWSMRTLNLQPGMNTVIIQALDERGNIRHSLTIRISARGT